MKEVAGIHWLEEVDSTNNECLRHIEDIDNLSVVAAVSQTAGRGQRGNSWLAKAGENLTFSMVLKFGEGSFDPLEADRQFSITEAITLGIADYLENEGIECSVKWPNDIYVRNRKICGILIENSIRDRFLAHSIVGIGLNVNQKEFPPHLVNPTSMTKLTGKQYDIQCELVKLCGFLRPRMLALGKAGQTEEYAGKLYRLGSLNDYVICSTGDLIKARIIGVTKSGLLRIEKEKGERIEFAFKEISYLI